MFLSICSILLSSFGFLRTFLTLKSRSITWSVQFVSIIFAVLKETKPRNKPKRMGEKKKSLDKCLYVRQVVRFCYLHCEGFERFVRISFNITASTGRFHCLKFILYVPIISVIFTCCVIVVRPRSPNDEMNEREGTKEK